MIHCLNLRMKSLGLKMVESLVLQLGYGLFLEVRVEIHFIEINIRRIFVVEIYFRGIFLVQLNICRIFLVEIYTCRNIFLQNFIRRNFPRISTSKRTTDIYFYKYIASSTKIKDPKIKSICVNVVIFKSISGQMVFKYVTSQLSHWH